ncbi:MAG: hypothetical protein D6681_21800 [Calditrichaeota bacterium]|nr:MAG: hypothetical protein D6681_21800 [Calditrichota bacterium]
MFETYVSSSGRWVLEKLSVGNGQLGLFKDPRGELCYLNEDSFGWCSGISEILEPTPGLRLRQRRRRK